MLYAQLRQFLAALFGERLQHERLGQTAVSGVETGPERWVHRRRPQAKHVQWQAVHQRKPDAEQHDVATVSENHSYDK